MNSNYISTQSLYDPGAHLAHAKQYSHKYIKREPDGKGGYRYWYKTDRPFSSGPAFNSYVREDGGAFASRNMNYDDSYATFQPTKGNSNWMRSRMRTAKDYRNADKASQIYREGQSQNAKDYQSRINQASKKTEPKVSKEYKESIEANSKKNVYPSIEYSIVPEHKMTPEEKKRYDEARKPQTYTIETPGSKFMKKAEDYAKQTLNTISSAAGSAYDKGKKFLQGLFK